MLHLLFVEAGMFFFDAEGFCRFCRQISAGRVLTFPVSVWEGFSFILRRVFLMPDGVPGLTRKRREGGILQSTGMELPLLADFPGTEASAWGHASAIPRCPL